MLCKEPVHEECYMKDQCLKYAICPMVLVQDLLSGKWKILILWYLSHKTLRFSDIKKRLPQVTQKMLTLQLRSLEEDKLIFRTVYPIVPPKVEYCLTEVGKRILPILEMMHSFGSGYLNDGLVSKEIVTSDISDAI
jgi:DNA-binding HxlR family transcriptional regulator